MCRIHSSTEKLWNTGHANVLISYLQLKPLQMNFFLSDRWYKQHQADTILICHHQN